MLPTDLLMHRQNGEEIIPKRLKIDQKTSDLAIELINYFQSAVGKTQGVLEREVLLEQVRNGLYADLSENKILTVFDAPTAPDLLNRYNLSQVQGVFYKASKLVLNAHRNVPGEYKLLFRYLKLFQLMAYIE